MHVASQRITDQKVHQRGMSTQHIGIHFPMFQWTGSLCVGSRLNVSGYSVADCKRQKKESEALSEALFSDRIKTNSLCSRQFVSENFTARAVQFVHQRDASIAILWFDSRSAVQRSRDNFPKIVIRLAYCL